MHEAAEKHANEQYETLRRKAAAGAEAIDATWRDAKPYLDRAGLIASELQPRVNAHESSEPLEQMDAAIRSAGESLNQLKNQRSLRQAGVAGFLQWFALFAVVSALPVVLMSQHRVYGIIGAIGFTLLASVLLHLFIRSRALRRSHETAINLATALASAKQAHDRMLRAALAEHKAQVLEAGKTRNIQKNRAEDKYNPLLTKVANRVQADIAAAEDKHERDAERWRAWQLETLRKAESHFNPMLQQCIARHDATLAEAERLYEARKQQAESVRATEWKQLADRWRIGQDRLLNVVNHLRAAENESFLPWEAPFWKDFPPVVDIPKGIRFGKIAVDLRELPGGLPEEEELAPAIPVRMELPAFLPFPDRCSLVLKARDAGRDKAVQQLQEMMLRYLTAIPAGKVRFTVIDPIGLGDNFAAFMHLGDYDENLIGARIWTEPAQIEKRLADLTAHMENVIQKYLRNQYKSIEEYNIQAGEVAEPFRVLVVANFPANFSLESCRRLVSIVQSGSTCGVCTLISIDSKLPVPPGFNIADLEQGSANLVWKNDAFIWKDPDFAKFPLALKSPPASDEIVRLVRIVGERGRDANRVQVPFDAVMPAADQIWKGDSRKKISVAIGRAGAQSFSNSSWAKAPLSTRW